MTILVYISIKLFFFNKPGQGLPYNSVIWGPMWAVQHSAHPSGWNLALQGQKFQWYCAVCSADWTTGNLPFLDPTLNTLENALDCTPKWGTQYPMSRCPLLPRFSLRGRGLQYIDFLPCWKKWYDMLLVFDPLEVSLRYPSLHLHGLIFYLQSVFLNRVPSKSWCPGSSR